MSVKRMLERILVGVIALIGQGGLKCEPVVWVPFKALVTGRLFNCSSMIGKQINHRREQWMKQAARDPSNGRIQISWVGWVIDSGIEHLFTSLTFLCWFWQGDWFSNSHSPIGGPLVDGRLLIVFGLLALHAMSIARPFSLRRSSLCLDTKVYRITNIAFWLHHRSHVDKCSRCHVP